MCPQSIYPFRVLIGRLHFTLHIFIVSGTTGIGLTKDIVVSLFPMYYLKQDSKLLFLLLRDGISVFFNFDFPMIVPLVKNIINIGQNGKNNFSD